MTALFVHDTRFVCDSKGRYYSNGLNSAIWDRYLSVFDNIIVCGRETICKQESLIKENISSHNNVEFKNISNKNAIKIWFTQNDRKHVHKLVKQCDVVIARLDSIIGFLAIHYALKEHKAYIIELVTDPWDCYVNYGFYGKILAPFIYYKTRKEVKRAEYVIYVTNHHLQKYYPCKNQTINISNVECIPQAEAFHAKLKEYIHFEKNQKIIIGTAGALLSFKGQQFVIEAIGLLRKQGYTNFEYWLAGDGTEKNLRKIAQKNKVEDCIHFLGTFDKAGMNKFYQDIAIYIQPSLQEGLPRTVIEAMSRGLYCLGSRTAGTPELLPHERIFENRDSKTIADMLKALNKMELQADSKQNYENAHLYSVNVLFNRRKEFLTKFVSNVFQNKINF